jgi:chemotaxis protein CheC
LIDIEEIVAGIYLPVKGAVIGAALLIFPKETAFTLSDLLVRREPGTTRKLTELDKSALKETGNIICGTYFAVLANTLQIKLIEQVPNFSFDMFGAIITQIITEFAQNAEEALVIELEFLFKPATLKGYLLLLLNVDEFRSIVGGAL